MAAASNAMTLAPVAAPMIDTEDEEVLRRRLAQRRKDLLNTFVMTVCYFGFGFAYYCTRADKPRASGDCESGEDSCVEPWNPVDVIYFSTVTMTTVGYGDLKPLTAENRTVTIFFILFGMIVSASRLHQQRPLQPACERARRARTHAFPSHSTPPRRPRSLARSLGRSLRSLAHPLARSLSSRDRPSLPAAPRSSSSRRLRR